MPFFFPVCECRGPISDVSKKGGSLSHESGGIEEARAKE